MSDQYTRISSGGSPLPRDAAVVGLLFGNTDDTNVLQVHDADDIPTEVSDSATLQVDLHLAVFPQHSVVGWYRVSSTSDEQQQQQPTLNDLQITQALRKHYDKSPTFVFCLLQVGDQDTTKPMSSSSNTAESSTTESGAAAASRNSTLTLMDELPINLYELHEVEGASVLLGVTNWQLETSDPERIAVERVMRERPAEDVHTNVYVSQTMSTQQSLSSLQERIHVLLQFLQDTQNGTIPPNYSLLRHVQGLLYSLGPLSYSSTTTIVGGTGLGGGELQQHQHDNAMEQAELYSHLAAVADTVCSVQSYVDKFRLIHESKTMNKEMRQVF